MKFNATLRPLKGKCFLLEVPAIQLLCAVSLIKKQHTSRSPSLLPCLFFSALIFFPPLPFYGSIGRSERDSITFLSFICAV